MAHPHHHALSSVKKWGGSVDDYLPIHEWFDATKAHHADFRHRALRHHAEGIFLCEQIFGTTLTTSTGREIPVRWVGEQHVTEDLGRIPALLSLDGVELAAELPRAVHPRRRPQPNGCRRSGRMAQQILAVMKIKKETPGKIVFEEIDTSPHFDAIGVPLNIYVPKPSAKTLLGAPDTITLLIEPGDQTKAGT